MLYHLHIHPRDGERLTVSEWNEAVAAVRKMREEAAKSNT